MADTMQDLDVFLTAIESKLRDPFSSLELAKAVQTASLRKNNNNNNNNNSRHSTSAAVEYLDRLSQVLHRTDKITQLRILVGLLGLDPVNSSTSTGDTNYDVSRQQQQQQQEEEDKDEYIDQILTQAQEAPLYEDWVRVIAGIVQGIMFDESSDAPCSADTAEQEQQHDEDKDNEEKAREATTCRGKEANELLEKTCNAIIDKVCELEQATAAAAESTAASEETADADPTFAPFRYALLQSDLLHQAIPETKSHAYFQIDESASILNMDANLDRSKAQEEKEHNMSLAGNLKGTSKGTTTAAAAAAAAATAPTFPGFRSSSSKTATATKTRPKSSMFLAAKKPTAVARTALHTRKKGAAQALVGKGRSRLVTGSHGTAGGGGTTTAAGGAKTASLLGATSRTSSSTSTSTAARGRALNATTARSKMKMIDVQEVQGLAEEQKEREEKAVDATSSKKKGSSLLGQKRKAISAIEPKAKKVATTVTAAATRSAVSGRAAASVNAQPTTTTATATPAANTTDGALVSAALSAYQTQVAAAATNRQPTSAVTATASTPPATKLQDWREMLKEKSNRLSAEDRLRVEKFFTDKYNPTPDQPTYKMKLHERRTNDPKTGEPVKETFYLELDYTNFTSKQSKKTKRYSKDTA